MEFDLYRNDGSILFSDDNQLKTSNGSEVAIVTSGFKYIRGFKQLNSTHIVVVVCHDHCIIMYNREDKSKRVIAGECGVSGYIDGISARFDCPWGIEVDERNPGRLLITDGANNALRSVDVTSGTVTTVIRTGFIFPTGLTWYHGRLLASNFHYISEVTWTFDGTVTNSILTGNRNSGYRDGAFTGAQFYIPFDLRQWRDGIFLVADYNNKRLRLLDMTNKNVLPVCIGSTTNCTTSTSLSINPSSLLIGNNTVYVGNWNGTGIYKLVSAHVPSRS